MKTRHLLVTTLAFTLPAWSLSAQENTPPPRPPDAAPREGAPHPERRDGPQRPVPGLFGALDANHDGVIDNEEVNRAADLLRKLDRNSDGKIGVDEFRGPGEGQPRRPEGGEARKREGDQRPPGAPDAGPRREAPRQEGDRERRPDGDRRGPDLRAEGHGDKDRDRGPQMHQHHDRKPHGDRNARSGNDGPHREGPMPPPNRDGDNRRDGRDGAPRGDSGPQARHHHGHHHHHHQGPGNSPMAQRGPRPDHNRIGEQPRWPQPPPNRGPENRYAFGPRFDGPRLGPQMDERRDARGPAPQQWNHHARPPQGGQDGNRFANPPRGPQPQYGPDMRRFEPKRGDQRPSMQQHHRHFGPPPQGFQQRDDRGPGRPPQGPPPGPDGQPRPPQHGASFDSPDDNRQAGPPEQV